MPCDKVPSNFSRLMLLLIAAALIPVGFSLKWYGNAWLADSFDGAVYEIFFILLFTTIWPSRRAMGRIAVIVFIATSVLEVMQLWHPPLLETIRRNPIGRALIGTTFSWSDFAYYVIGCILGYAAGFAILQCSTQQERRT